ncbi:HNH endonuclease signature motif containing protein [Acinetobacter sp. ANC 3791]|uniref:HNH endonuclease signature motif containing protein n=1 Tax=Acinetobacter sp. ANC 3791 TaxID=2529836 RepID=UPI00103F1111|nr:HNH endonuclease signature motif containing protein [Acinetobacter sp. ANC 3791]TCB85486.1 HNH endonuclease [Acinetobacter sp. ANC 3791]
MSDSLPSPQEQLKFLKQIQQILHSGSFSSTYKFALLMSLCRLAIEQGQDNGDRLTLDYLDIAEKFIDLYWKQTLPFHFNENEPFLLHQNNGKQAGIVSLIHSAQQRFKSIALARRDYTYWSQLKKKVADTVKKMPVTYLQNIKGQNIQFLYCLEDSQKQLVLLPQVMYCLRQFSEIIEELCQKRWIDFIRLKKQNLIVLNGLPDLDEFMFAPNRSQLGQVASFLIDLQKCQCFYCGKSLKNNKYAVDHFIPWSLYPADTGHNFVLADDKCNSQKSNYLASEQFLNQWLERNHLHDQLITHELSKLGFLTDIQRSHRVADWAYGQAKENGYLLWNLI